MNDASQGVIFDMDELLLDSAPHWRAAAAHLMTLMGAEWTPEFAARYQGRNAHDVACFIHREIPSRFTEQECVRIMRDELIRRFREEELKAMPGAVELIRRLHGRFPMAVASGSPLPCIELAMRTLGIAEYLIMLSSESVPRGKPEPDVFLAAAEKLGLEPGRCVVFEDSFAGVQAGKAAGMRVFAVPSGPRRAEVEAQADRTFASLADVRENDLSS